MLGSHDGGGNIFRLQHGLILGILVAAVTEKGASGDCWRYQSARVYQILFFSLNPETQTRMGFPSAASTAPDKEKLL